MPFESILFMTCFDFLMAIKSNWKQDGIKARKNWDENGSLPF